MGLPRWPVKRRQVPAAAPGKGAGGLGRPAAGEEGRRAGEGPCMGSDGGAQLVGGNKVPRNRKHARWLSNHFTGLSRHRANFCPEKVGDVELVSLEQRVRVFELKWRLEEGFWERPPYVQYHPPQQPPAAHRSVADVLRSRVAGPVGSGQGKGFACSPPVLSETPHFQTQNEILGSVCSPAT